MMHTTTPSTLDILLEEKPATLKNLCLIAYEIYDTMEKRRGYFAISNKIKILGPLKTCCDDKNKKDQDIVNIITALQAPADPNSRKFPDIVTVLKKYADFFNKKTKEDLQKIDIDEMENDIIRKYKSYETDKDTLFRDHYKKFANYTITLIHQETPELVVASKIAISDVNATDAIPPTKDKENHPSETITAERLQAIISNYEDKIAELKESIAQQAGHIKDLEDKQNKDQTEFKEQTEKLTIERNKLLAEKDDRIKQLEQSLEQQKNSELKSLKAFSKLPAENEKLQAKNKELYKQQNKLLEELKSLRNTSSKTASETAPVTISAQKGMFAHTAQQPVVAASSAAPAATVPATRSTAP